MKKILSQMKQFLSKLFVKPNHKFTVYFIRVFWGTIYFLYSFRRTLGIRTFVQQTLNTTEFQTDTFLWICSVAIFLIGTIIVCHIDKRQL